jgi:hypothetical protein
MNHNDKPVKKLDESASYQGQEFIGKVSVANFPRIKVIYEGIPAPKKQFKGGQWLYPQELIRRC